MPGEHRESGNSHVLVPDEHGDTERRGYFGAKSRQLALVLVGHTNARGIVVQTWRTRRRTPKDTSLGGREYA
jgi:hypothetical protein